MELTNFHLGRSQKAKLKARAKAHGSKLADELRQAVDLYLTGINAEEIELLNAATRCAESDIAEMIAQAEAINRRADAVFAELEALRAKAVA
jgi:hypothetical protein